MWRKYSDYLSGQVEKAKQKKIRKGEPVDIAELTVKSISKEVIGKVKDNIFYGTRTYWVTTYQGSMDRLGK